MPLILDRIAEAGDGAQIYIRPLGFLRGPEAVSAIASGIALPLTGYDLAFTMAEISVRSPMEKTINRLIISAPDVMKVADQSETITGWLATLAAERPPIAGLLPCDRPIIMGIVNVTPDSFSDGGDFADTGLAVAHAQGMLAASAHILDIGGESTRPNAAPVSPDVECRRVVPVIAALAPIARAAGALISIDTRNAATMQAALKAGAAIINDVSALTHDPDSLGVAATSGASIMLMHMRGTPQTMQGLTDYDDVTLDVFDALAARIAACEAAGIPRARLIADPGIGFAKTGPQNIRLLAQTSLLHGLGVPLMIGVSRKGFIGWLHRAAPPKDRLPGSLAAGLGALAQGAQILRVHDVAETSQALAVGRLFF